MQRNKICIAMLLVLGASFALSCKKDYLKSDQYFKDRLNIEKTFKSKVYSEEWLAHVFEEFRGENADVASKGNTPHCFADDMYYGDRDRDYDPSKNELSYNMFKMGQYTENDKQGTWTQSYRGIRNASTFIQNIYMNGEMSAAEISDYRGQARFARAYLYWLLLRKYGPVPLLPDEGLDYTESYDDLAIPRSTYEECATYISDELLQAAKEMETLGMKRGERREFYDMMFNYDRSIGNHNIGAVARFTRDALIRTVNLGDDIKNGIAKRNQALAGRLTYNWKSRYIADFNFGYNGSENFAPGRQYGFFPAVSAAWNIGEEPFVKENISWMNMFKIRYSWGKVGNDQLAGGARFPYLSTISEIGHFNNEGIWVPEGGYQWADYGFNRYYGGMKYSQVSSSNVTWEMATKKNLGFDLALFKDKIIANLDFFNEKRTGIYMARNYLPALVGLESVPSANVGAVKSKGFDGRLLYNQKLGEVNLTDIKIFPAR